MVNGAVISSTDFDEIILTLYWDQIKPYEVDIIRRAAELNKLRVNRCTAPGGDAIFIESSKYVVGVDPSGRKYVELNFPPDWFLGWIDLNLADNSFGIAVWEGFEHFMVCFCIFSHTSSEETGGTAESQSAKYQFKGGRYGLAKRLQECVYSIYDVNSENGVCEKCCEFLELIQFESLGRLCQLVQQGVNAGILRYEDNVLQPALSCRLASAALAARLLPPLPPHQVRPLPQGAVTEEISSICQLEEYLELVFTEGNLSELPLSQLKKKLISQYHIVLNPSRLGFVKISDVVRSLKNFKIITNGNNASLQLKQDESLTPSTCVSESFR
jgi:hypothetical protein